MDDTHVAQLLAELSDADPAEAAEIAERLAQLLATRLEMDEERGVVVVPIPAVVDAEAGNYVYVVGEDDRVAMQPVVVGRSVGDDVIVTEGLTGGETVVTDGQLRLVPGAQVQIRNIQTSPGGDA